MAKEIIDSVEKLEEELARVREAQRKFSTYTQEQVDKIFLAAAKAANMARIPLAKMAVEETGMGVVEDKIIKNHYAAEYIYNKYKNTKTCGVIDEDKAYGTKAYCRTTRCYLCCYSYNKPNINSYFQNPYFS